MKKILSLIIVQCLTLSAFSNPVKVASPFWSSWVFSEQELTMTPKDKGIYRECEVFEKKVNPNGNYIPWDGVAWDDMRKTPLSFFQNKVEAVFVFEKNLSHEMISASLLESNKFVDGQVRSGHPFRILKIEQIDPQFSRHSQFELSFENDSYSSRTQNLRLNLLPLNFKGESLSGQIVVEGYDAICDLLGGKASLQVKAPAFAKIPSDDFMKGINFFTSLENYYQKSLQFHSAAAVQAMYFGFEVGEFLKQEFNQSHQDILATLRDLSSSYFTPDFRPNQHWETSLGAQRLNFPGMVKTSEINFVIWSKK